MRTLCLIVPLLPLQSLWVQIRPTYPWLSWCETSNDFNSFPFTVKQHDLPKLETLVSSSVAGASHKGFSESTIPQTPEEEWERYVCFSKL